MLLPNKITAVVNYSSVKGSVELRDIKLPEIGDHDVLLQVENVGVCGSDLHQWTSDHSWKVNYPVVLGHEFGGLITKIGDKVKNWKIGDRVVSETAAVIDTESPLTKAGLYNLDPARKGFGYGIDGAMTKYVRTPARCLHHIPANLSFEEACLTEPCCVAYNAVVINSKIKPAKTSFKSNDRIAIKDVIDAYGFYWDSNNLDGYLSLFIDKAIGVTINAKGDKDKYGNIIEKTNT